METSVKERLKEYLKMNNIKGIDFCKVLNVSSGFISGIRESIQPDKIKSIAINYPDLNIVWLLTGLESMYRNSPQNFEKRSENKEETSSLLIGRIEKLSAENAILKQEIERLTILLNNNSNIAASPTHGYPSKM